MSRVALVVAWALAAVGCGNGDGAVPQPTVAAPTETDIWVAELLDSRRGVRVGTPVNVTDRPGYDNQPHFLPDGSALLYTSIDQAGQADIWRYEFDRRRPYRVTRTPESEYSPTPRPDGRFTVIRVEEDGTQRLWRFDADGRNPELLIPDVHPAGYQGWYDERRVALFVLGEPPTLAVVDLDSGESRTVLQSVGRSLQPAPGRPVVAAVHKVSEEEWNVVEVTADGSVSTLAPLPRPAEDFAWLPDGQLVVGRGAKLYAFRPGPNGEWREIGDFTDQGVQQITRIAVSAAGDRIAFVAQR